MKVSAGWAVPPVEVCLRIDGSLWLLRDRVEPMRDVRASNVVYWLAKRRLILEIIVNELGQIIHSVEERDPAVV